MSSNVVQIGRVQEELADSVANSTSSLPTLLRNKGYDISAIYVVSVTSSLVIPLLAVIQQASVFGVQDRFNGAASFHAC